MYSSSVWMPYFISCSCFIALDRALVTTFTRSYGSKHLCLTPNFKGKLFSLFPVSMILTVGFGKCPSSGWEVPFYFCFVECLFLYHECMFGFVNFFFHISWCAHRFCFFRLLIWLIMWIDFSSIKPLLHCCNEPQLVMMYNFLYDA